MVSGETEKVKSETGEVGVRRDQNSALHPSSPMNHPSFFHYSPHSSPLTLHEERSSTQPSKLSFKVSRSYPLPISTIAGSGSSNSMVGVIVDWPGGEY